MIKHYRVLFQVEASENYVQFLIVFCLAAVRGKATECVLDLLTEFNKVQERMDALQRETVVLQKENSVLQKKIGGLKKDKMLLKVRHFRNTP